MAWQPERNRNSLSPHGLKEAEAMPRPACTTSIMCLAPKCRPAFSA